MKKLSRLFLVFYKQTLSLVLRVLFGKGCRYTPTCSEYAHLAVVKYGPLKGVFLGTRRLLRCHPFAKGGFDPVP